MRKIGVRQARRWLEALEAAHGAEIVGSIPGRRGVRRFTTEAALASITPRARREDEEMREIVLGLSDRVAAIERRIGLAR